MVWKVQFVPLFFLYLQYFATVYRRIIPYRQVAVSKPHNLSCMYRGHVHTSTSFQNSKTPCPNLSRLRSNYFRPPFTRFGSSFVFFFSDMEEVRSMYFLTFLHFDSMSSCIITCMYQFDICSFTMHFNGVQFSDKDTVLNSSSPNNCSPFDVCKYFKPPHLRIYNL